MALSGDIDESVLRAARDAGKGTAEVQTEAPTQMAAAEVLTPSRHAALAGTYGKPVRTGYEK